MANVNSNVVEAADGGRWFAVTKGVLQVVPFECTVTSGVAQNEYAHLVKLPAGKVRVFPKFCTIGHSAFGSSVTVDVGISAHTQQDGTAVSEDVDALLDGDDMSAAGRVSLTEPGTTPWIDVDSQGDAYVSAKFLGADPAAGTLDGMIAFMPMN